MRDSGTARRLGRRWQNVLARKAQPLHRPRCESRGGDRCVELLSQPITLSRSLRVNDNNRSAPFRSWHVRRLVAPLPGMLSAGFTAAAAELVKPEPPTLSLTNCLPNCSFKPVRSSKAVVVFVWSSVASPSALDLRHVRQALRMAVSSMPSICWRSASGSGPLSGGGMLRSVNARYTRRHSEKCAARLTVPSSAHQAARSS